jgi:hypothetical protein
MIIVEHTDRAMRFGFRYLDTLLEQQGRHIEVVSTSKSSASPKMGEKIWWLISSPSSIPSVRVCSGNAGRSARPRRL